MFERCRDSVKRIRPASVAAASFVTRKVKMLEHLSTGTMSSRPSNALSFGSRDFAMTIAAADSRCTTTYRDQIVIRIHGSPMATP